MPRVDAAGYTLSIRMHPSLFLPEVREPRMISFEWISAGSVVFPSIHGTAIGCALPLVKDLATTVFVQSLC